MNVVFDLGGVVFTWIPELLITRMFTDPTVQDRVRSELFSHPDWLALDRGTLSCQEAIVRVAARTGLPTAEIAALLRQVPTILVAIPDTVRLLYRLKARGHRLFCLSNMHVASIEYLDQAYTFWEVFEGRVISCRIHSIKPEPTIYRYLLAQYALDGTDTVFIDDMAVNLHAAAQFGIRTIQFETPGQCEFQLQALGCL